MKSRTKIPVTSFQHFSIQPFVQISLQSLSTLIRVHQSSHFSTLIVHLFANNPEMLQRLQGSFIYGREGKIHFQIANYKNSREIILFLFF